MKDLSALDPLQPGDGFAELTGYRLTRWQEGLAEVTLPILRKHMNRSGVLHGGVTATLLDVACGYSGCFIALAGRRRRALTLSLTTQFIATVEEGAVLIAIGRKVGGGASVFFSEGEIRDGKNRLIARAEGVFKYRGQSGQPEGEPIAGD